MESGFHLNGILQSIRICREWEAVCLASVLLAGCGTVLDPAGTTHASYSRAPDGTESIALHDGKDRASFTATITKPDGTSFVVNSTDSNGSTAQAQAMAAQSAALDKMTNLLNSLLANPAVKAAIATH